MPDYTKSSETRPPVFIFGCEVCLTEAFVCSALT